MKAHQLNPEDLEVVDQLADIYLALGDLGTAEKLLEKGLNQEYLRSDHQKYRNFTTQRVEQLKEYLHFQAN